MACSSRGRLANPWFDQAKTEPRDTASTHIAVTGKLLFVKTCRVSAVGRKLALDRLGTSDSNQPKPDLRRFETQQSRHVVKSGAEMTGTVGLHG